MVDLVEMRGGEEQWLAWAAGGVFLALEPAVDEGLGGAGALHVGDDLGAGEGLRWWSLRRAGRMVGKAGATVNTEILRFALDDGGK
jgi:hypothetical protein